MAQTVITLKKKATTLDLREVLLILREMGYRGTSKARGDHFIIAVLDADYQPSVLSGQVKHPAIRRIETK